MCVIELEECEVWVETERTARKQHKCSCCGSTIERGDRYLVHFSMLEGKVDSEKICKPCDTDRQEFSDAHEGMTPLPSFFPTMLHECIEEESWSPKSQLRWLPMWADLTARRLGYTARQ